MRSEDQEKQKAKHIDNSSEYKGSTTVGHIGVGTCHVIDNTPVPAAHSGEMDLHHHSVQGSF